jgi:hypothetical protein
MPKELTVSISSVKDTKKIMLFIKKNWKKNHILSINKELFKYYYCNKKNLNFIIAKKNKKLVAIMAYILNSRYSSAIKNADDIIWPSMLVADKNYLGAGYKIYEYYIKKFSKKNFALININKKAEIFFEIFGNKIIKMYHYFLVNPKNKKKIIKINIIKKNRVFKKRVDFLYIDKNNMKLIKNLNFKIKNGEYIINKYLKNPFYNYKCVKFNCNKNKGVILVFRQINILNSSLLKIVDFTGNPGDFEKISSSLQNILIEHDAEYFDFVVSENFNFNLKKTNFYKKGVNDIVPSYFEPLVLKNYHHTCGYHKNNTKSFFIFKGDGDSDRPNIL